MEQYDLTSENVYEVLCQTLPKRNDFSASDYLEELRELLEFGITTKLQLLDLIVKYRDQALTIDREPLDDFHIKYYKSEYGAEYVEEKTRNKYWFAYPALLRIILELEFGEKYIEFANNRDNI